MIGSVISVLSLSWRYHNCPSLAALARDSYNIVPRVIKLISPHHSCDNLYLSHPRIYNILSRNTTPGIKCFFQCLSCFRIRSFSHAWEIMRILQCDLSSTILGLKWGNVRMKLERAYAGNTAVWNKYLSDIIPYPSFLWILMAVQLKYFRNENTSNSIHSLHIYKIYFARII